MNRRRRWELRNRRRGGLLAAAVVACAAAVWSGGCGKEEPPQPRGPVGGLEAQGIASQDILRSALFNLNHLEEFSSGEMLRQVVERLNQWIGKQDPLSGWKPDPLLKGLPEQLRDLEQVKNLGEMEFPREDAFTLQEAVWLRDLSAWARGNTLDELDQAGKLFDWTIRNIQFDTAPHDASGRTVPRVRQIPWETLLLGHGTPMDRAWIFMLLLREQGIDSCLLALQGPEGSLQSWAVGVRSGKKLYLFDTALGLPIPAPGEIGHDREGRLEIRPATLEEAASDDSLLRRLDLDASRPYPVKADDLKEVVALVAAAPPALSMRMRVLEDHLAGADRMTLTTNPTEQAKRLTAIAHVGSASLWEQPYLTILQRAQLANDPDFWRMLNRSLQPFQVDPGGTALFKGRVLYLKGKLSGEEGSTAYYQRARPPDSIIEALEAKDNSQALAKETFTRAKQNASYWLGLVSYELGNYRAAIDYFAKRTLEATPDGPWTHGARYNLARTYEAAGKMDEAILQYQSDPQAPGYHGEVLRARWLREATGKHEEKAEPGAQPDPKEAKPSAEPAKEPPAKETKPDEKPVAKEPAAKEGKPKEPPAKEGKPEEKAADK